MNICRFQTSARLSRASAYGPFLFFSGFTAPEAGEDIRRQAVGVLKKIDDQLTVHRIDKTRLLTVQIWLRHIERDFSGFNEIWDAWTDPEHPPCRYAGEVKTGNPSALVELICVAAAGEAHS